MSALRIGGLFEGYGGLTMGVQAVLGGELAWYSEIEPAAVRVLGHHHPDVPNLGDITTVDWSAVESVDVLTGGFPCQDVSSAGRRVGMRPGTRSGLWSHMRFAISQLRPDLVVIENVRGLLSADAHSDLEPCPWCLGDNEGRPLRALGAVLGDLASLGYVGRWHGLRAADVGAPHGRFRVFIAAWPAADTQDVGHQWGRGARHRWTGPADGDLAAADPAGSGVSDGPFNGGEVIHEPEPGTGGGDRPRDLAEGVHERGRSAAELAWGPYEPAIRRWELILGRPAPAPTQAGRRGGRQLSPLFVEWLMGLPEGHVTGVPELSRTEQLKLLGNGVVPVQASAALSWLLVSTSERAA